MTEQDKYNELSYYTLSHKEEDFIHQHVVDAVTAQTATEETKLITIFFALAGLYLFVEKNIQESKFREAHMLMAKSKKEYISITFPENRGEISIENVLDTKPGSERDEMIKQWCASVWDAYSDQHDKIISVVIKLLK